MVGDIGADLITSVAKAERHGSHGFDPDAPFEPDLDSDLLALQFDAQAMRFLGFISASLLTHISADLGGGNEVNSE